MAENNDKNILGDNQLDPSVYGLWFGYEGTVTANYFDGFMNYIGAYYSTDNYYINILALQGVRAADAEGYLQNGTANLKLVENKFGQFDDAVILRYRMPYDLSKEYEKGVEGFAEREGLKDMTLAGPVIADPALGVTDEVIKKWEKNFLTPGDHVHVFPATVNPGSDSGHEEGTAQIGFGQHIYKRGMHKSEYHALVPCTIKSSDPNLPNRETYGWRKPAEQRGYNENNVYENLEYTNLHQGNASIVGGGSTGCINIQGGSSDRYSLFMLTAYMHGGPSGYLTNIPVTVWPGVDFLKCQRRMAIVRETRLETPELHFASRDTKTFSSLWRNTPGWVEKMQRILWGWRGGPDPEPKWGVFDYDTVHRLLRYFQDHAIKNLNDKDSTKHYYRRLYTTDPNDWKNDELWTPREKKVLAGLSEEKGEAICGPATWEAMRFFCPDLCKKWAK